MAGIWVLAEQRGIESSKQVRELLAQACDWAKQVNSHASLLLVGCDIEGAGNLYAHIGLKDIIELDSPSFARYDSVAWIEHIEEQVLAEEPKAVLMTDAYPWTDFAPRFAMRNSVGYMSGICDIEFSEKEKFFHSLYAGRAFAIQECEVDQEMTLLTIRPKSNLVLPETDEETSSLRHIKAIPKNASSVIMLDQEQKFLDNINLTDANIIVAGGRGVGGAAGFVPLKELATLLGGAVAGSRAAVDEGWIDLHCQVGQTGKSVSPQVYIACGISGAMQHLAGMRSSRCVIAINKNPQAKIFEIADYGIVGDVFEIVPQIIQEIKNTRH